MLKSLYICICKTYTFKVIYTITTNCSTEKTRHKISYNYYVRKIFLWNLLLYMNKIKSHTQQSKTFTALLPILWYLYLLLLQGFPLVFFFYITFYTNNDSDKRALDPTRLINVDIIGATCTVCHEKWDLTFI